SDLSFIRSIPTRKRITHTVVHFFSPTIEYLNFGRFNTFSIYLKHIIIPVSVRTESIHKIQRPFTHYSDSYRTCSFTAVIVGNCQVIFIVFLITTESRICTVIATQTVRWTPLIGNNSALRIRINSGIQHELFIKVKNGIARLNDYRSGSRCRYNYRQFHFTAIGITHLHGINTRSQIAELRVRRIGSSTVNRKQIWRILPLYTYANCTVRILTSETGSRIGCYRNNFFLTGGNINALQNGTVIAICQTDSINSR